jgi:hypothetical protein
VLLKHNVIEVPTWAYANVISSANTANALMIDAQCTEYMRRTATLRAH